MSANDKKIVRIAEAYGIEKKWGLVAAVAEKLNKTAVTVSSWKKRGVPYDILAKVARDTGANFEYLDTGEGQLFINHHHGGSQIAEEAEQYLAGQLVDDKPLTGREQNYIKMLRAMENTEFYQGALDDIMEWFVRYNESIK